MICRDTQEIKLQEAFYTENKNMPAVIECTLYDSFVGTVAPGDVIQLVGVLHAQTENDILYKLVISANNIKHINNKNFYLEELGCLEKDFKVLQSISKTPNLMAVLINSLYPTIYGNELIKAGLVLALFGGTQKYAGESPVRSEIHVLIVGDPGLGKSRMLLASCQILPKSSYVSGSFTTAAGLTVAITHDPVSGEYMVDAGALAISDCGVCCLDEFDKIEDHSSLFEAMESQKITVAKGGVICSVPTHTTVIAAANPKHGHFDLGKSIRKNLKLKDDLLSVFDLVFILIDNLTEQENYNISDQILKKRMICSKDIDTSIPRVDESNSATTGCNDGDLASRVCADSRLKSVLSDLRVDKFIQKLKSSDKVYPLEILKKYISYAKNSVFPTLSVGAKDLIKQFYLKIRSEGKVTTRDLESLIRLTESKAKIELRSIATQKDAEFVIELYKRVNILEKKVKKKLSTRELLEKLHEAFSKSSKDIITDEDVKTVIEEYSTEKTTEEIIEMLNYKGMLIKKGKNKYKYMK